MSDKSLQSTNHGQLQPRGGITPLWDARQTALSKTHYKAKATRNNPCALVIMIDQSASMNQIMENGRSKAAITAEIVNAILQDALMRCQKEDGLREYFNLIIFGYGEDINIIWEGDLADKSWISVQELQDNVRNTIEEITTKQTPFGEKQMKKEIYQWVEARSDGRSTSMKKAFEHCVDILNEWVLENEDSFPPMVFNITDGQPTDIGGDLNVWLETCEELKSIATKDGNTLLFNILLTEGDEIILPTESDEPMIFEDEYHEIMYQASSFLPYQLKDETYNIFKKKISDSEIYRNENPKCVVFNSTASSLLYLISVGTITITKNAKD